MDKLFQRVGAALVPVEVGGGFNLTSIGVENGILYADSDKIDTNKLSVTDGILEVDNG